jgi:hypothetical protein
VGQTGRVRVSTAVHKLVAVAMLLLALGAGILVSAGSAHHQPATVAAAAVVETDAASAAGPLSAHGHHHGNQWAPTLNKRLRPVATAAVPGAVAVRPAPTGVGGDGSLSSTASPPTGDVLALLGVLRV